MNFRKAIEILEIENKISLNIVKKQYRKLIKKFHPDISKENDKAKEITEAYKWIRNFLEQYEILIDDILEEKSLEERTFNRFKNDWLGGKYNGD